jgi:hypothetical protein
VSFHENSSVGYFDGILTSPSMSDLNEEAYSLNKFTDYIEELQSYDVVLEYIKAAALSVRRL